MQLKRLQGELQQKDHEKIALFQYPAGLLQWTNFGEGHMLCLIALSRFRAFHGHTQ